MVAPGSRNTPLSLALTERAEIRVEMFVDERSAAFAALGWSLAGDDPAVVLCTSGTAATHFHAAVVEAHQSGVPLLVVTADRPPELHGVGAPQTIDQQLLYGGAVRDFVQLDAVDDWAAAARSAWDRALGASDARPGPVHLNVALRDPLATWVPGGLADPASPSRGAVEVESRGEPGDASDVARSVASTASPDADVSHPAVFPLRRDGRPVRGVVLAGAGVDDPDALEAFAARAGWPILADPRSGCRHLAHAVCAADAILRADAARRLRPDVVVQLGMPPASKVIGQWIAASGAEVVAVSPVGLVSDPYLVGAHQVHELPSTFCTRHAEVVEAVPAEHWWTPWARAEAAAQRVIDDDVAAHPLSEIAVARRVSAGGAGEVVVVSSSMPVRDVEWFGVPGEGARVLSNRGANGIDGVVATAIGVAMRGRSTTVLLGDVALCHDASSLVMLARRSIDLAVVVVDNDGGGIFSFLPQAQAVPEGRFETLFGTPHGTDLVALARAHGITATSVSTPRDLDGVLAGRGVRLAVVVSDRVRNVADHARVHASIAAAVDAVLAH